MSFLALPVEMAFMAKKPKLSMYWASSCGGCEIALVNLHERILEVDGHFELVFCPCLLDTKRRTSRRCRDGGHRRHASSTGPSEPRKTRRWRACCAASRNCWWPSVPAHRKGASQP